MSDTPIHLAFEAGTLVLTGGTSALLDTLPGVTFDGRTGVHRAEGRAYRTLVEHLRAQQLAYKDEARAYDLTPWPLRTSRDPFSASARWRRVVNTSLLPSPLARPPSGVEHVSTPAARENC